jgi:hypothetical protein
MDDREPVLSTCPSEYVLISARRLRDVGARRRLSSPAGGEQIQNLAQSLAYVL